MFFFDHARREETRPASLRPENLRDVQAEIDWYFELPEEERRQTDVPQIWKRPFADDVLPALMDLSYGKCAFCERAGIPLQPYRFRPPAYATPRTGSNDKESYLWLAFDWNNLYPICEECLPKNKSFFPISNQERKSYSPHRVLRNNLEDSILIEPGSISQQTVDEISNSKVLTKNHENHLNLTISHFSLMRSDLTVRRTIYIGLIGDYIKDGFITNFLNDTPTAFGRKEYIHHSGGIFPHIPFAGYLSLVVNIAAMKIMIDTSAMYDGAIFQFDKLHRNLNKRQKFEIDLLIHRIDNNFKNRIYNYTHGGDDLYALDDNTKNNRSNNIATNIANYNRIFHSERLGKFSRNSGINSIEISGYKSIRYFEINIPDLLTSEIVGKLGDDTTQEDAACLLVIGENAAGKSSILEAIALATMRPEALAAIGNLAPVWADSIHDPRLMGAPGGTDPTRASIKVTFNGGGVATVTIDPAKSQPERTFRGTGARPLVFAYGARRFYTSDAPVRPPEPIRTLFDPTAALPNPITWLAALAKRNPRGLDEVVSALRHVISIDGHFRDIEAKPNGDVWINVERSDALKSFVPIPLKSASSGYRAVLAMVCDIFRGLEEAWRDASGSSLSNVDFRKLRMSEFLVLIDEIEAHLHPRWKMSIIGGLRRAFPRATFIMTSHDPLCLRGMNDGEVLALHRHRSGERDVVEAVSGFEGLQYRTVEQLLTSDLFRLMTTDPRSEREFDHVAELLTRKKQGASSLTEEERATLRRFEEEIAASLPIGNTPVGAVVQEAVAEFLKERRHGDREAANAARDKAKAAVKSFLKEVLG